MPKQMSDPTFTPTHEQITRRAYEIFVERGQPEGHDLDHWLEAERQLRASGQSEEATHTGTHIRAPQGNGRSQNGGRPQPQFRAKK